MDAPAHQVLSTTSGGNSEAPEVTVLGNRSALEALGQVQLQSPAAAAPPATASEELRGELCRGYLTRRHGVAARALKLSRTNRKRLWAQQTNPSANVDGPDQKCPIDSNASIVWQIAVQIVDRKRDDCDSCADIDLTMTTGLRTGMKNCVAILAGVVWHQHANLVFS